jgi:Zn-finger nucleic acid-binding protein
VNRLETRYPCPVCIGVKLEKVRVGGAPGPSSADDSPVADLGGGRKAPTPNNTQADVEFVLDHCPRCGGVWFEAGEVQRLRRTDATALWREILRRDGVHAMLCHSCRAPVSRTESDCTACGWKVELDCPICERPLRTSEQNGLRLDYCPHDRGVWFDHHELTDIWKIEVDAVVRRRGSRALEAAGDVALLDVLAFDPFLLYYGASAAVHVAGAAAEAVVSSGGLEAASEIASVAGDAASSLFETIVEIIGGLFG